MGGPDLDAAGVDAAGNEYIAGPGGWEPVPEPVTEPEAEAG